MLSDNDKDLIIQMMRMPGWELLMKEIDKQANSFMILAEQPNTEEHYRLLLFAKARGMQEICPLAKNIIK